MSKQPFFSIIIPAYNVGEYLPKCLDSVIGQSFTDYELIIVNDGSVDNTAEIIQEYAQKFSFIKALEQPNQGQGAARNKGVQLAAGEYIWFIDADDYILAGALFTIYNEIKGSNGEKIDALFFTCKVIEPLINESRKEHSDSGFAPSMKPGIYQSEEMMKALLAGDFIPLCWNKIFSRSIYKSSNYRFSANIFFEDISFNAVMINNSERMKLIRNDLYVYDQRPGSTMTSVVTDKHIYSIFSALSELTEYAEKSGLRQKHQEMYSAFFWRQLAFIYDKFIRVSSLEKNHLFVDELNKATNSLGMEFYVPNGQEQMFPFAILLKLISESEFIDESLESKLMESFNFPEEFIEAYM